MLACCCASAPRFTDCVSVNAERVDALSFASCAQKNTPNTVCYPLGLVTTPKTHSDIPTGCVKSSVPSSSCYFLHATSHPKTCSLWLLRLHFCSVRRRFIMCMQHAHGNGYRCDLLFCEAAVPTGLRNIDNDVYFDTIACNIEYCNYSDNDTIAIKFKKAATIQVRSCLESLLINKSCLSKADEKSFLLLVTSKHTYRPDSIFQ